MNEILGSKLENTRFDDPFFEIVKDDEILKARDRIKSWCESFEYGEPGFYLASPDTGRCKTALLACTYNSLIGLQKQVIVSNMEAIMCAYRSDRYEYESIRSAFVLLFDDIGIENFTGYKGDEMNAVLYDLINFRYNNNLTTCFTSNYGIKELKDIKSITKQTADRIRGMTCGNWIEIGGTSLRERVDLVKLERNASHMRVIMKKEAQIREFEENSKTNGISLDSALGSQVRKLIEKLRNDIDEERRHIDGSGRPVQGC